jgi:hypothetical protein
MPITSSVVFCDDLRFEINGKMFLIGVYAEDLVPVGLPLTISLSAWVRITGVPPGVQQLSFAMGVNDEPQVQGAMTAVVQEGKESAHLNLIGLPVHLTKYGRIFLTLSGFSDGSSVHAELPVVPAPTGPEQRVR